MSSVIYLFLIIFYASPFFSVIETLNVNHWAIYTLDFFFELGCRSSLGIAMGDNSHISSFSMIRFDIKMLGTRAIINLFSHSFSFSFLLFSTMNIEPDLLSKCLEHKQALNLATLSLSPFNGAWADSISKCLEHKQSLSLNVHMFLEYRIPFMHLRPNWMIWRWNFEN